jgi:hypothetical protein
MGDRRLGRRRHVELPRPQLRTVRRRTGLRPRVRRIEDGAARPGQQYRTAVRRRRRLRRRGRRARRRRRRARDRADQPEGRGARIVRPAGRADGECGSERAGDYVEVGGRVCGRSSARERGYMRKLRTACVPKIPSMLGGSAARRLA